MGNPDDGESRASNVDVPVDTVGVEEGFTPTGSLSPTGFCPGDVGSGFEDA